LAMAKKTVTSWKGKKVYPVLAPENFEFKEVGETLASEPEKTKGRTVNVSLGELLGDRSKNYLNLVFEVEEVKGGKAYTRFKEFFIPIGYLRSKVRKRTTKIDYLRDLDVGGEKMRIEVMVLSHHKFSVVQKEEIKARMAEVITEHSSGKPEKLIQNTLFGKLGTEIYKRIKAICPVTRVEVYHLKMLR